MKLSRSVVIASTILGLCLHSAAQLSDTELDAAFRRCKQISDEISQIRSLKLTNAVPVKVQTKDEFVKYMMDEISHQYGGTNQINDYVDALVLLGALKEKIDFVETVQELMVSQAAAHYDPRNKIYYLLMTDMDPFYVDVISSHELCHALQDQNFDLAAFMMDDSEAIMDNADMAMAKQCLAEGGATIVMTWWSVLQQAPNMPPSRISASVSLALGIQGNMDFDTLKKAMKTGAADGMGAMATSVEDLDKFPRFFVESLFMAYLKGALAVDRVRTRGGWKAVDELYRNPPTSTEQILHPNKLIGERDEPVDIRLPKLVKNPPKGWKIVEEDVLGELGTKILFSNWIERNAPGEMPPVAAAAGWDGDRYYYLKSAKNEEMLVWETVWDSEKDARQFETAMASMLKKRYPDARVDESRPGRLSWTVGLNRKVMLRTEGKRVTHINAPSSMVLLLLDSMR